MRAGLEFIARKGIGTIDTAFAPRRRNPRALLRKSAALKYAMFVNVLAFERGRGEKSDAPDYGFDCARSLLI